MKTFNPHTDMNTCPSSSTCRGVLILSLIALILPTSLLGRSVNAVNAGTSTVAVLPEEVLLFGREGTQRLLVQSVHDGGLEESLHDRAEWSSSNAQVVRIDGDVAVATGDGEATISVKVGGSTASVPARVTGFDRPFEWSFRHHVLPVLSKADCNSGACHGAAAGQKGFKLSLRGHFPAGDFDQITRQAQGRRIEPSDPGRSLLLLKPTTALPHKGGQKIEEGSKEYRVLSGWIAAGTPGPAANDPSIVRIEVLPRGVTLQPGAEQPLVVLAHYSTGRVEDVTRWAKYTATSTAVAEADEHGHVVVRGHGECAITVWYSSRIAIATVTVPYEHDVSSEEITASPQRNLIDALVLEKLSSLRVPPSARSSDEEFLRRAFVDTIGVLPTADEARRFLTSEIASQEKRDALIDELLARPEFIDYWTYKWSDLLLVTSRKLRTEGMWSFYKWIRNHVEANTPWDEMVHSLLVSSGSTLENGGANFYVLHQDPRDMAETSSQAFMGLSIGCAKCHNHPLEKWTNDQYYGMANLFARVRTKSGTKNGERIVFSSTEGELIQPLTGRAQPPRPLDGIPVSFKATADRRLTLADWMVDASNPYFSRAVTNRVWANFMGVGIVEAVDDLRVTNPPSNPRLLDELAGYLVEQDFDLKALMRLILQSNTYQRSSRATARNSDDERFYSRYYPRRLRAEVLLDAFSQVTGVPTPFAGYASGWRAMQLPDSNVASYFLQSFGRPAREQTCECERTAEPSVSQVLHITNGSTLNDKLGATENYLSKVLESGVSDKEIVEDAFLRTLSRFPRAAEAEGLLKVLGGVSPGERRATLEDIYWSLVSTKEFLFNH